MWVFIPSGHYYRGHFFHLWTFFPWTFLPNTSSKPRIAAIVENALRI